MNLPKFHKRYVWMGSAYLLLRDLSKVMHVASVTDIAVATAYHRRVFFGDMCGTSPQIRNSISIVRIVNIFVFNSLSFRESELRSYVF